MSNARRISVLLVVVLVVALVGTGFSAPFADAAKQVVGKQPTVQKGKVLIKKQLLLHQWKAAKQNQRFRIMMNRVDKHLAKSQTVENEALFQGQIDFFTVHQHAFQTDGGTVHVELSPSDDSVGYMIVPMDPDDNNVYLDGDNLPAGAYGLVVFGGSGEIPVDYSVKLTGIPFTYISQKLPQWNVTSPDKSFYRMDKTDQKLTVKAGTDAPMAVLFVNDDEPLELTDPQNVQQDVYLQLGFNTMSLMALNHDGSALWKGFHVIKPGLKRMGGKDRFEVSANISKEISHRFYRPSTVVLARGDVFTDALSGVPLAVSLEGAPILLTNSNGLPAAIKEEIKRLAPERAVILGGTGSISTSVETQLKQLGIQDVERISGSDRFAVSAAVSSKVAEIGSDTAIVVSGTVFSDAMSSSSVAGWGGMPILLTLKDQLPAPIKTFIAKNPQIENFIIVGGPGTVSDQVKAQLLQARPSASVERIGGADRYEVGVNVIHYFGLPSFALTFARGDLFSDALSGAPLAANMGAPILLTPLSKLDPKVQRYLDVNEGNTDVVYIFGGSASVSDQVAKQLYGYIP
ncbi:cell wall-binding repeat-containing protein [Polycladomyces sp. WAk]|uniref:Cell wall-binding repeat-containing protein n=1 Tax=Polycladomyces zharkentensis TaxID=2807616 RepID=A0ABS2WID5_9BACL|nr:cell wall-binding repeat-containing protein [Polycladomyces sp. WAk]MBN2909313.1 cell wall-binding repeat-containing protein [Polycladomyces sp. WAk]